jgi:glutamate carboxypeptidase
MAPLPAAEFERRLEDCVGLLGRLVEIESPTDDKAAVDSLGRVLAHEMVQRGAAVRTEPQSAAGDHCLGTWGRGAGGILLLAHMDTVYPRGTLARTPFRREADRLIGPGVLDMKGGIAIALTALGVLHDAGRLPAYRVDLLCTSDEERGSHTSRSLLEREAREHDLVLCLEPGLPDGSVKTWRKGIGEFAIEVTGRAAHAGANPEAGINAIAEMARVMERVLALADPPSGTTVNPGVITGGTFSNVVPETCRLEVDIRVLAANEQERVDRGLASLRTSHPDASLKLTGDWNRPPMPRTRAIAAAFERAREIGSLLGERLTEGGSGGGSDANFVAALGMPVLDGLGAIGNHAHSEREYVVISSLSRRAALLAACLTEWRASG